MHLVYAIKNKIRINWPYYVVKRIYNLKDSVRRTTLGYASFIQHVLNKAAISVSGLPLIGLSIDQEFTHKTLTMMGHQWDASQQQY